MYAYTLIVIIQNIKFPYSLYRSDQDDFQGGLQFPSMHLRSHLPLESSESRILPGHGHWVMPPLQGILQEGPGMGKAPTLWTRLVFPSTSRCHFVFSINFVYPKSLNLQIS